MTLHLDFDSEIGIRGVIAYLRATTRDDTGHRFLFEITSKLLADQLGANPGNDRSIRDAIQNRRFYVEAACAAALNRQAKGPHRDGNNIALCAEDFGAILSKI